MRYKYNGSSANELKWISLIDFSMETIIIIPTSYLSLSVCVDLYTDEFQFSRHSMLFLECIQANVSITMEFLIWFSVCVCVHQYNHFISHTHVLRIMLYSEMTCLFFCRLEITFFID